MFEESATKVNSVVCCQAAIDPYYRSDYVTRYSNRIRPPPSHNPWDNPRRGGVNAVSRGPGMLAQRIPHSPVVTSSSLRPCDCYGTMSRDGFPSLVNNELPIHNVSGLLASRTNCNVFLD